MERYDLKNGSGLTRQNFSPVKVTEKRKWARKDLRGFTLIELLVVISIISLLSSIVFAALGSAREKAKIAAAKAQLKNVETAIALLEHDTGKWPNGCPPHERAEPEVSLDDPKAGLKERPPLGVTYNLTLPYCEWTVEDRANWKGPYIQTGKDPWGTSYEFDPDYSFERDCSGLVPPISPAVFFGPNKTGSYDCDSIYLRLDYSDSVWSWAQI
ncbi:MAG: General secretion pathway protein G [Parcubacteria group bacterium GW2011_GWA1_47_8]|nr:MAG: General secretion pathway protein G [Parcubacteria group bacterium GW2011_GWA1_47_8]KKW07923.1 MAG: General secretion pathway protein G [Parcubacteria group bacterium GW2011_GWA2_49_16]